LDKIKSNEKSGSEENMKTRHSAVIVAAVVGILLGQSVSAQVNELGWTLDSALKQIEIQAREFESSMSDLKGTWISDEVETENIEGRIYFNDRSELRLVVTAPADRVLLIDGKYLYDYYPVQAYVDKFYLPKNTTKLLPFANLGFTKTGRDLKDNYLVTLLGEEQIGDRRVLGLELTPKKDAIRAVTSRIELWIDQASWVPVRQVIYHVTSGAKLVLDYTGTSTNLHLNPDLFKAKWPRGTKVIKR